MPVWCAALLVVLVLGTGALAQQASKRVHVVITVVDPSGATLEGASVTLNTTPQGPAGGATDKDGKLSLQVTGNRAYKLDVRKTGYLQQNTQVHVGLADQQIEVTLTPVALSQQSVDVRASSPDAATEPASIPSTLDTSQAAQTASRPATLKDVLPLIPGVVRGPDGKISVGGFEENHSTMLVNSVNVTDPATGDFGISVPVDSVDTVGVAAMPYLAQYGKFTAGVVTAQTRRGGEKWDFGVNDPLPEFRILSGHLRGLRSATPRVNLTGPIIRNKLYLVEGVEYLLHKDVVRGLPFPNNETDSRAVNSFTQFDYIFSSRHSLTASFHVAPHTLRYAGLNYFDPQPVTPDARFREGTAAITDRVQVGAGVLESIFAYTKVSSDVRPQTPGEMILTPLGNQGSYFSRRERSSYRSEWLENWTPGTVHWTGEHELQIGLSVARSANRGSMQATPALVEDASGHVLQRYDFNPGTPFRLADTSTAIYAQDHWQLARQFGFDIGLRLEGQSITSTWRAAPRGGFVWSPGQSSRTVVRGGVGVFYDSVPLDVYAFRSYPNPIITTYDATGAVIDGPRTYYNVIQQMGRRGFHLVHRSLVSGNFAPYSIGGNVEVERTLSRMLVMKFKYSESEASDRLTVASHIVRDHGVMSLSSNGSARTRQFEVSSRVGGSSLRQFFVSYVRQQARGDINDASTYVGNFPYPIVRNQLTGSLPSEVPNRILLWGTYALPKSFRVMPQFEYRTGFPYQYTDVMQQYLSAAGQPRFPSFVSLDLSVSKDFNIPRGHAVRVAVSVLNLTNHFNPLQVHANVADPALGTFLANYPRHLTVDFDFLH